MSEPTVAVRFALRAEASPGLLPRVLEPFAKRDLTPDRVQARREGGEVVAEVVVEAAPEGAVHLLAGNLRQIVGVFAVEVAELRPALARAA